VGQTLRRNLGPVSHLELGEYTVETRDDEPVVRCPKCGGVSDLELEVYRDGTVEGFWSCLYASCSFQSYLLLEGWGEEVLR